MSVAGAPSWHGGIKGGHQEKMWYLFLSSTPKRQSPANRRGSSSEQRQRNKAVPRGSLEGAREGKTRKWPLSGDFEVVPTPPQPAPHKHRKCSLQSPATQVEETPGQIAAPSVCQNPFPTGGEGGSPCGPTAAGRSQPHRLSACLEPASSPVGEQKAARRGAAPTNSVSGPGSFLRSLPSHAPN